MSDSKHRPRRHFGKNGPTWWRKMTTDKPNRAKAKAIERNIERGADADAVVWPKWNRPKIYWW